MAKRGYDFSTNAEREIVRDYKEKLGYIAQDYDAELEAAENASHLDKHYELPDGQILTPGPERFQCPEVGYSLTF